MQKIPNNLEASRMFTDRLPNVFVKQYGYYRSGTNWTRAVIEKNFRCKVLVHQLGCKHDASVDWANWLKHPDKPIPSGLPEAVHANRVRVVVTIKDPYAWLDSFLLYQRGAKGGRSAKRVAQEVKIFNQRYCLWACHGQIVQYERLLSDYSGTLKMLGEALQLTSVDGGPHSIEARVDPHPDLRNAPFDPVYFLEKRYLQNLSKQHRDIVTATIDWSLFGQYGYAPDEGG